MNPYLTAVEFYNSREDLPLFGEGLHQVLLHGFVHSTPSYFIMASPVNKDELLEDILDMRKEWKREEQNCWHIWFASGKLDAGFEVCPYQLPFVSFHRNNVLRTYAFRNIHRVVKLIQERG